MTTEELTQGTKGATMTETASQVTETTTENEGAAAAAASTMQAPTTIESEGSRLTPEKIASKAKARKTAPETAQKNHDSRAESRAGAGCRRRPSRICA